MKIGITGYRKFNDYQLFCSALLDLQISKIIAGGATGADSLAQKYAHDNHISFMEILPLFKTDKSIPYHISHFHIRNRQIVDNSDLIIAFLHPISKGTKSTIQYAKKTKTPVTVINII